GRRRPRLIPREQGQASAASSKVAGDCVSDTARGAGDDNTLTRDAAVETLDGSSVSGRLDWGGPSRRFLASPRAPRGGYVRSSRGLFGARFPVFVDVRQVAGFVFQLDAKLAAPSDQRSHFKQLQVPCRCLG